MKMFSIFVLVQNAIFSVMAIMMVGIDRKKGEKSYDEYCSGN
jgi:hypothetical protein